MKLNGKLMVKVLGAAILIHCSTWAGIYNGPTTTSAFNQLLADVQAKSDLLSTKILEANLAGVNTDYAQVSLTTIDLFKDVFAPWDRANPTDVQAMYNAKWFIGQHDPVGANGLPFDELADCLEVADAAIAELAMQTNGLIVLQDPPDLSTGNVSLNGAYYEHNGKRVIPARFFWHPFDEDLMQAYGRMGEGFLAITDMQSSNVVKSWRYSGLINLMTSQTAANRVPQQYFLGHTVGANAWQRLNHPDVFATGSRLFTHYDIDHPFVRPWLDQLFDKLLDDAAIASGSAPRIHMLANEPVWSIRQGGVDAANGVSSYTMDNYRAWLQSKYGSITILNLTYGTGFTNFNDVNYTIPIDPSHPDTQQGKPVWYDWCRFNMDRVNDWFTYLKNGVQSADPGAPTHLKLMGERSIHTDWHDEGLDFEFVTKLVEIPGSDNQCTSLRAEYDVRFEQDWRNRDVLEWRSQAIMLDFMKSLGPDKPFFDSEWHGLSGSRWRDFHTEPEYVRAVLWLAAVDGLSAMNAWVWNRHDGTDGVHENGEIDTRADFIGTTVTQPLQLDAFGRIVNELNAHGDDVTSLVPDERYYVIYYCKDSAIQDINYSDDMTDVYEALKLQNIPVGFTTPTELFSVSNASQTLIVPRTRFISNADLAGLQGFDAGGGEILVVQPSDTFTKTELGGNRGGGGGFTPFATVNQAGVTNMANAFKTVLADRKPTLPVTVDITTTGGSPAYGVLSSQHTDPATQRTVLSLINVNQNQRNVALTLQPGIGSNVTNLITGQPASLTHSLAPHDILFLSFSVDTGSTNFLWDDFVTLHSLSGIKTNNADNDRLSDWGEYVFDGNPNDSNDLGVVPAFDATAGEYTFQIRNDSSLIAHVLTKTNLTDPVWSTNETINVTTNNGTMGVHISNIGTSEPQLFIQLRVGDGAAPYQFVIGEGSGTNGVASSGNGNFEDSTGSGSGYAISLMPHWFNLSGAESQTCGSTTQMSGSPEPNSQGCWLFQTFVLGNDTGYTVSAAGETFHLGIAGYAHTGNPSNYGGDEKVVMTLFTSDDPAGVDAGTGTGNVDAVLSTTKFTIVYTVLDGWMNFSVDDVYTTVAGDIGKTIYLSLTLENPTGPNVFPRFDVVTMEVNK